LDTFIDDFKTLVISVEPFILKEMLEIFCLFKFPFSVPSANIVYDGAVFNHLSADKIASPKKEK